MNLKSLVIFFYITSLLLSIIPIQTKINTIEIKPHIYKLSKNLEYFINKPRIFINEGVLDYIFFRENFSYSNRITYWDNDKKNLSIHYKYFKPVFLYNNFLYISNGKKYNVSSGLLLPNLLIFNLKNMINNEINVMALNINKYFSIKLIENIIHDGVQWKLKMRNNQEWVLGFNLKKTFQYLNKYNYTKKDITNLINDEKIKKVFITKKGLFIKYIS